MTLGRTLSNIFGGPGWMARVPAGTLFDFVEGRMTGPAGTFLRSPASGLWVAAS